jgi:hypothetical protein
VVRRGRRLCIDGRTPANAAGVSNRKSSAWAVPAAGRTGVDGAGPLVNNDGPLLTEDGSLATCGGDLVTTFRGREPGEAAVLEGDGGRVWSGGPG